MIVVVGEALIDLIVRPEGAVTAVPGGGPYNTARTLARLGHDCAFVGSLSSDRFGTHLSGAMAADGVRLDFARVTHAPTTLAVAELDAEGAASYRFYVEGTSAPSLLSEHLPTRWPDAVHAMHVGTLGLALQPVADTVETMVRSLDGDTLLMVDLNARPAAVDDLEAYRARLRRLAAQADVVKASAEDLQFVAPGAHPRQVAKDLVDAGSSVVLLTSGASEVVVIAGDQERQVLVPEVPVVDTVGAGDSFGGAFLAAWHGTGRGRDELGVIDAVVDATEVAVEVAVVTCQRAGADPPRLNELPETLAALLRPAHLRGDQPGP